MLCSYSDSTVTVSGSFGNLASGESQGVGWTVLLRRQRAQTLFSNSFSTLPYWKFAVNRVIDPEEALVVQSVALIVLNSCG